MNDGFNGFSDGRGVEETRISSTGPILGRAKRLRFANGTNTTVAATVDRSLGEIEIAVSATTAAPVDASYVCIGTNATLTAERVLTGTASVLTVTDGGAGGNVTLNIPTNAIDNTRIRDGIACSVIGRSANSTGDPADIQATTAYFVLHRNNANALVFGLIGVNSLTYANARAVAVTQASAGAPSEINASADYQVLHRMSGGTLAFSQINEQSITLNTGASVMGRTTGTGTCQLIAAATDYHVLHRQSGGSLAFGLIDQNSVNFSSTDRILGRATAGAGAGELITCTSFGRSLIDDADAAAGRTTLGIPADSCNVYNSANQSIANATDTVVTFDSEYFDTASLHSTVTNTGRITISKTGKWFIGATIRFAANSAGRRIAYIRLNGSTICAIDGIDANTSMETYCQVNCIANVSVGDYFEVLASQNSGGNLDVEYVASYSNNFYAIMLDN